MRPLYLLPGLVMVVFIISITFFLPTFSAELGNSNMRCSTFVRMDLGLNKSQNLIIDAVINFQRVDKKAVLLIKGTAETLTGKTDLSREVQLSRTNEDSEKGYQYIIDHTSTGATDTTPETVFNEFLSEISGDDKHVYLDDQSTISDAVLMGGPYSDLFMCVKY